jgi:NTE family protein
VDKKYRIGLVLSGGGTRGFAHLGVIQALIEAGIHPDVVSGTSAGAIVGVLFTDGYSPKEIMKLMNSSSRLDYFIPAVPRGGFLQMSGLIKTLKNNLRAKSFEDLKIPLYVAATDLNNGKAVYFSSGDLLYPVIASASIPVLFRPLVIDNVQYVDGGVLDNLPIKPIEGKCRYIIGSFVNPTGFEEKVTSVMQIAERTFLLSMSKEFNEKAGRFDLLIAPEELRNFKILDPERAPELFELGYKTTKEKLQNIDISSIIT